MLTGVEQVPSIAAMPVSRAAHGSQRRKEIRAWTLPPNYLRTLGAVLWSIMVGLTLYQVPKRTPR